MDELEKRGLLSVFRNARMSWFKSVDEEVRRQFAEHYARHVYEIDGQACVVVDYPVSGRVACYDLDGAQLLSAAVGELDGGRRLRSSEPQDYEFPLVQEGPHWPSATDIQRLLFPGH